MTLRRSSGQALRQAQGGPLRPGSGQALRQAQGGPLRQAQGGPLRSGSGQALRTVRIFGIDPGSLRTGYGCVESDGSRAYLVTCGAITVPAREPFAQRLARIYRELSTLIRDCQPECVAVENLFHAANVRSALKLGHARGVAMLAAVEAGCELVEYTPAEVKRAVVGYGRAEKPQVQQMVKLLLGMTHLPSPHDAADALAIAICHLHAQPRRRAALADPAPRGRPETSRLRSWRDYRPPATG